VRFYETGLPILAMLLAAETALLLYVALGR
jgi:hypothetical protein